MTDEEAMHHVIAEAELMGRVRFAHPNPQQWWREVMGTIDACADAMVVEAGEPPALVERATDLLRELADLLGQPCGPGMDVLGAICAHAPAAGAALERVGREGLPVLTDAAARLHRHIQQLSETSPGQQRGPLTRRMLHAVAELYGEGFRDTDDQPATPSHGTTFTSPGGSPFRRMLTAALAHHAETFEARHGVASPLQPDTIGEKAIRLALDARPPAVVWPGAPEPRRTAPPATPRAVKKG